MGAVGQLPDIAKAASAQGFIFGIIDRQSSIDTLASVGADGSNAGVVAAKPAGQCGLELRGVSFSYPSARDTLALLSVNLDIRGGESTALVGGSGSGKSTVLRLLQVRKTPSLPRIRANF
jgi:ABC-type bacteriocin/lantibiotic exporter with double-glycine peptidase domain